MRSRAWLAAPLFLGVLVCAGVLARAADPAGPCAACGMAVDAASPYAARIGTGAEGLAFCDIGDLVDWLRGHRAAVATAEVRDLPTGAWLKAAEAFFVRDPQRFATPMQWGIAAFARREDAAAAGTPLRLADLLGEEP